MATQGLSDVHYFLSTDSGAPSLSRTAGAFINVVKKCLIDGFGTTAPQGSWAIVDEATNRLAIQSTAGLSSQMCFYIDDTGNSARVCGYETMSDIDTGLGQFGDTGGTLGYIQKANNSSGSRPWVLIASSSAIYFFSYFHDSYSSNAEGYFFGDLLSPISINDGYRCAILSSTLETPYPGGNGVNQNNFYQLNPSSVYKGGCFVSRAFGSPSYGDVGFFKTSTAAITNYVMGGSAAINNAYPDTASGKICVDRVQVFESDSPYISRGIMPGLYAPLHSKQPDDKTIVTAVPDVYGHDVFVVRLGYSTSDYARAAIDITGPWEYPGVGAFVNTGTYGISGIVTEFLVPGAYRVLLFRQLDGALVRTTWSDSNGAYAFTDLAMDTYIVMAIDHTNPKQTPAVQDNVVPS